METDKEQKASNSSDMLCASARTHLDVGVACWYRVLLLWVGSGAPGHPVEYSTAYTYINIHINSDINDP